MLDIQEFELSDFHTHSFASDGVLSRVELIRRAAYAGYKNICIADHCGEGDLRAMIEACVTDCALASSKWNINAIPGIELTHIPPEEIDRLAKEAKALGAVIVIVHGESIVEPVMKGTNGGAAASRHVDILSHPGLISDNDLIAAKDNGIFIEITVRAGHSLTNGYVAARCKQVGAKMVLNSDAHTPGDLLNRELVVNTLIGAGLNSNDIEKILLSDMQDLIKKVKPI